MEHSPGVCVGGRGGGGGEGRRRGFENGGLPTKTYDVLQMLIDQNYTMFFNIENDYYR